MSSTTSPVSFPLTIQLPQDLRQRLAERASAEGQDLAGYVQRVLENETRKPTVDEALAPFRKEVEESGMTEDELEAFFEEVREEVWQEKHGRSS